MSAIPKTWRQIFNTVTCVYIFASLGAIIGGAVPNKCGTASTAGIPPNSFLIVSGMFGIFNSLISQCAVNTDILTDCVSPHNLIITLVGIQVLCFVLDAWGVVVFTAAKSCGGIIACVIFAFFCNVSYMVFITRFKYDMFRRFEGEETQPLNAKPEDDENVAVDIVGVVSERDIFVANLESSGRAGRVIRGAMSAHCARNGIQVTQLSADEVDGGAMPDVCLYFTGTRKPRAEMMEKLFQNTAKRQDKCRGIFILTTNPDLRFDTSQYFMLGVIVVGEYDGEYEITRGGQTLVDTLRGRE